METKINNTNTVDTANHAGGLIPEETGMEANSSPQACENEQSEDRDIQPCQDYPESNEDGTPEDSEQDEYLVKYGMPREEYEEAMAFLKDPDIFNKILDDYEGLGYVGEQENCQIAYLAATSRLQNRPISVLATGESSSGKSELVNTTFRFLPNDNTIKFDRVTAKALFHQKSDDSDVDVSLSHKAIIINEAEGIKDAEYAIRALLSESELVSKVTVWKKGRHMAEDITVRGPIALFTTTTGLINPENHTRMFEVNSDESEEQTKRIHRAIARERAMNPEELSKLREAIIRRHQNAQKLLKDFEIMNPYSERLSFPTKFVRSRRDFPRFLSLIDAIAYLKQYQKDVAPDTKVIATDLEDYRIAYKLGLKLLMNIYDPLKDKKSRELLDVIREMVMNKAERTGEDPRTVKFTRRDIQEFNRTWSVPELQRHLPKLQDFEYLLVHEGRQGRTYTYSLPCLDAEGNFVPKDFTTPEELEMLLKTE